MIRAAGPSCSAEPTFSAAAAPPAPRPARSLADRRLAAAVEEMAAELAEAYPDPVDLFENDLARKLGLERHRGDSRRRL